MTSLSESRLAPRFSKDNTLFLDASREEQSTQLPSGWKTFGGTSSPAARISMSNLTRAPSYAGVKMEAHDNSLFVTKTNAEATPSTPLGWKTFGNALTPIKRTSTSSFTGSASSTTEGMDSRNNDNDSINTSVVNLTQGPSLPRKHVYSTLSPSSRLSVSCLRRGPSAHQTERERPPQGLDKLWGVGRTDSEEFNTERNLLAQFDSTS